MTLAGEAAAADGAVIIMYHRFDESAYPSTNITLEQFDAHLDLLKDRRYTVLPIPEILETLRSGDTLPDRTVGISIDDAYLSVFEHAWPRLKKAGFPFTLFVATDAVDRGTSGFMSWDQIRTLRDDGVTIGGHTASHAHLAKLDKAEVLGELKRSQDRYRTELGAVPALFAYPYGEASNEVRDIVIEQGYKAAFGQHSGFLHRGGDPFYMPRFAFNERYGSLSHFRLRVNAMALPVSGVTPSDPLVAINPPAFGFTVEEALPRLSQLACYHPQFDSVSVERLGPNRFEIRFPAPLKRGRSRLNCTVPGPDRRYRWFGWQFYVKAG